MFHRLRSIAGLLIALVLVAPGGVVLGQEVTLDVRSLSLDEALTRVGESAGIDVVFAHRFTAGVNVSCRVERASVDAALACLLTGTDLRAEKVRGLQWVVVPSATPAKPLEQPVESIPVRLPVEGLVRDARTGEPLAGANVYLPEAILGTTAGAAGEFALGDFPRGAQQARVSFVGYRTRLVELTAGLFASVELEPVALETAEILVEAKREDLAAASSIAGSVAVLERQQSRSPSFLTEDDLFQSLQWLPAVRQSGEVGGELIVRGAGPDQSLHVLDGAPLYHPWHTMGLFSTLQTEVLKDAQLYTGSIPAEFGGRLSAVLDTRLKDGNRVDPHVQASVGSTSSQFVAEAPLTDRLSVMVGARRSYSDGFLTGTGLSVAERTTLQNSNYGDLSAKVTARPWTNHEFRLSFFHGRDRLPMNALDDQMESVGWNRYVTGSLDPSVDRYRWDSQLWSLQHGYLHGTKLLLTTTAFWSGYQANDRPDETATVPSELTVRLADVGLKVDADYFTQNGHTVRAGAHLTLHDFRNAGLGHQQLATAVPALLGLDGEAPLTALENAAYVQDTWNVHPRLQVQPGLRVSTFSGVGGLQVMPRLNARVVVHPERLLLKGGFGRQVQYVHQVRDRFADTFGLSASRWVPASMDGIEAATGRQVTLGAESRPLPALELAVDAYWRSFRKVLIPIGYDVLEGPEGADGRLLNRYHPGRQQAAGVEFYGAYRWGPWRGWGSYATGRSLEQVQISRTESSLVLGRFHVPHTGRAGVNWARGRWAFSVAGELRSGYPVAGSIGSLSEGGPTGVEDGFETDLLASLPAYARLDARVGYRLELLGVLWNAQIDLFNMTNRRNVIGHLYALDGGLAVRHDLYGLPRLPLAKLRVEF